MFLQACQERKYLSLTGGGGGGEFICRLTVRLMRPDAAGCSKVLTLVWHVSWRCNALECSSFAAVLPSC